MTLNGHPALIAYPSKAFVGSVLPKSKIYEFSGANTRLKGLFVEQVDQIIWQYKLAPETINLPASPNVPEIQIFSLRLKTSELHDDVLRCIDGAIPFPIVFELTFDQRKRVTAAHKRPNEADTSRWVLSDYFASDWLPTNSEHMAMSVALHLDGLYEQLLHRLIPLQVRPQEPLVDLVARAEQMRAKQRELDRVTALLGKEKQFNRKVEINAQLRHLKKEYEALTH